MVVSTLHRVRPEVVAHLQVLADFLARESHHIETILIFVEVEHVAHTDRTLLDDGIHLQWGIEGNVGMGDLKHQVEDEVVEGTAAEE